MKQSTKNKLLALATIGVIKEGAIAILLLLIGASAGYALANKECDPCMVGFASLEDMMFLVAELRQCKGYNRNFDNFD